MIQEEIIRQISAKKIKNVSQFVRKFCGELIGAGVYRDVYILNLDDRFVVKIERDMSRSTFANVTEWRNYINNREWIRFSKYLAPCLLINETGQILIQRRATRIIDNPSLKFPDKIPSLFTDIKKANWGYIGKQPVCFDYSFLLNVDFRIKKVKWRN
jgi:hypothetical protein